MMNNKLQQYKAQEKFRVIDYLLALYFAICPMEFALNKIIYGSSSVKYIGFVIVVVILVNCYKNRTPIKINLISIYLILWLLINIVSVLWSTGGDYSFIYLSSYINITIFFISLTLVQYNKQQIKLFIDSVLLGTSFTSVLMLSKLSLYHGKGIRYSLNLFNTELDPNNIAAFLAFGVIIALYYAYSSKKNSIIFIIITLLNFIALSITGSRGGFVTIIVSVLFLLIFKLKKKSAFIKKVSFILYSVSIFSIILIVFNYFVPFDIIARLTEINSFEGGSERALIWEYGFKLIKERPLLGYGIGSFPEAAHYFFGDYKGMHNTYLMLIFDVGFIGFSFFLSFIYKILRISFKKENELAVLLLISAIIPAFFLDVLVKRFFWNGIIIAYMLINQIQLNKSDEIV